MASRWQSFSPLWNQLQDPAWNQLQNLQGEMNRLFNRWMGDGGRTPAYGASFPAVNMWEDADTVYVEAELPGVDQKDLEIFVTGNNQFTLKGQRRQEVPENGVWHRQERGSGSFTRVLNLPFEVNRDKVDARLDNGVLLVKLAKHEMAKPRKITVKGE
jgi:HSP20 family protein